MRSFLKTCNDTYTKYISKEDFISEQMMRKILHDIPTSFLVKEAGNIYLDFFEEYLKALKVMPMETKADKKLTLSNYLNRSGILKTVYAKFYKLYNQKNFLLINKNYHQELADDLDITYNQWMDFLDVEDNYLYVPKGYLMSRLDFGSVDYIIKSVGLDLPTSEKPVVKTATEDLDANKDFHKLPREVIPEVDRLKENKYWVDDQGRKIPKRKYFDLTEEGNAILQLINMAMLRATERQKIELTKLLELNTPDRKHIKKPNPIIEQRISEYYQKFIENVRKLRREENT